MAGQGQTVAIIGCGAIGSYYGARLAEAGQQVHFLMRRDYEAVRAGGLRLTSPDGNCTLAKPAIARRSTEIGPVDWVVCALKATALADAQALVEPCLGRDTRILVLMNGLGLEERFAEWFGPQRVFGGLAFTCVNRGAPGTVNHLAYGQITIGHFRDDAAEVEKAVALWSRAKVKIIGSTSLQSARWQKLCWNVPFAGLAVAAGGITVDRILADRDLSEAARTLMAEVIEAGNADLAGRRATARLDGDAIVDSMLRLTATMGAYRSSTVIDFGDGKEMEIEAIFGEPLRRARLLGIATPHLALLSALLQVLNVRR